MVRNSRREFDVVVCLRPSCSRRLLLCLLGLLLPGSRGPDLIWDSHLAILKSPPNELDRHVGPVCIRHDALNRELFSCPRRSIHASMYTRSSELNSAFGAASCNLVCIEPVQPVDKELGQLRRVGIVDGQCDELCALFLSSLRSLRTLASSSELDVCTTSLCTSLQDG